MRVLSIALAFVVVVPVMVLSVTVFKGGKGAASVQQNVQVTKMDRYQDRRDQYPVVEAEETGPKKLIVRTIR